MTTMAEEGKQFTVSRGYSWYVFSLLFIMYVFDYIDRLVIASLFPYMKADWGLTDTQCGLLSSIVTITMTVFVLPISILVDRWSRKKAIGIMSILWSLAAFLCTFTKNFGQLISLRAIIGVGEASYTAGGHAMIAAYFPEGKRSTMNGLFNAAVPMGTAIGVILGGVIAERFGWQYAFGITAIPGFFIAMLFFWIKDYKTIEVVKSVNESDCTTRRKMKAREIAKEFLNTPSVLFTYAGYIGVAFATNALMTWLPTYFHRTDGLPMDKAGMKSSLVFLLSIIGLPVAGLIVDALRKRWINFRLLFPAITSLVSALLLYIAFSTSGTAQYAVFILIGFIFPMYAAATTAVSQDVVHPGLRALSYSLVNLVQMSLGYSLGPIFIGAVSDRYDLLTAFKFLPLFVLSSAVLFFVGSFYYERDLHKVEKIVLEEECA